MKQTRTLLIATLTATLLGATSGAFAQSAVNNNWQAGSGAGAIRNGDGTLCWRDNVWTPATADAKCDGAPKPVVAPTPVASSKVTLFADALFDTAKSNLKPEGIAKLNDLAAKLKDVTLEVIIVIGFTDSQGSLAYNKKLSLQRAESVKKFLTEKGIETGRVYTEGKAFAEPVGDNKTAIGRALNRRAVIEVIGTRKVQ
jgi:OOP family OmpA-OmpF porin